LCHGENARQGQDCGYFQEGCSHLGVLLTYGLVDL
jgi:hypothetical protein